MWRAFDASAVALRKDLQNLLDLKARRRVRSIRSAPARTSPLPASV